jgi:hypothetical protein
MLSRVRNLTFLPDVYFGNMGFHAGRSVAACLCAVLMIFTASCNNGVPSGRLLHESKVVESQGAGSVRVRINVPAGKLTLVGGASKLMESDFRYVESEGAPQVSYTMVGKAGQLELSQPGHQVHLIGGADSAGDRNDWNLRFNSSVPAELTIDISAGYGDLRVGQLSLSRFNLDMGAGIANVDFRGDWKKSVDAEIHGGVGDTTIVLPTNVGVRVHTEHGIGTVDAPGMEAEGDDYVNAAYRQSPVTLRLTVKTGVGSIKLVSAS